MRHNMEKTISNIINDKLNTENLSDEAIVKWLRDSIFVLREMEKQHLCKMYIQGRNDSHLDYYPQKHANETYIEFFEKTDLS